MKRLTPHQKDLLDWARMVEVYKPYPLRVNLYRNQTLRTVKALARRGLVTYTIEGKRGTKRQRQARCIVIALVRR